MVRIAIVTRNAIHGGVETMIAMHQACMDASVFVVGGHNQADTCPFEYTYIDSTDQENAADRLLKHLRAYDVILYHWIPDWALETLRQVGKPCIEVVHRTDTGDSDKDVPTLIVTHSQFLKDWIEQKFQKIAYVIPHGIDVAKFPDAGSGEFIGAITSYYLTKGIDLFLEAWSQIKDRFPDERIRFYGSGDDLNAFRRQAANLGIKNIEFLGPVQSPEAHYGEFKLFVLPSRVEGMPFTVLEALVSNIPVVCSDLEGMVEFNRLAEAHGFPPPLHVVERENPKALADKLATMLGEPNRNPDTRRYIEEHYNVENHCRQYWLAIGRALAIFESSNAGSGPTHPVFSNPMSLLDPTWTKQEIEQLRWLSGWVYRLRQNRLLRWLGRLARRIS